MQVEDIERISRATGEPVQDAEASSKVEPAMWAKVIYGDSFTKEKSEIRRKFALFLVGMLVGASLIKYFNI